MKNMIGSTYGKTALTVAFTLALSSGMAQEAKTETPRKISREERRLIHDAGMIPMRVEGKTLSIVDFRTAETVKGLTETASKLEAFTRLIIPVEKRTLANAENAVTVAFSLLDENRGAVVAVVEDSVSPSMSVFPEDGVAVVNVKRLSKDLPEKDAEMVLEARFSREIWRAVAFVLGGYETEYRCVVKNIRTPVELDVLPRNTCPPASEKIFEGAAKLNLSRIVDVSYASAVQDGTAPPPKTAAQKSIVEYYKAIAATNAPAATPPAK